MIESCNHSTAKLCTSCREENRRKKDHAHMYRALQLLLGRVNDTPWHEVRDRDVQSWINFAKNKLEHEA